MSRLVMARHVFQARLARGASAAAAVGSQTPHVRGGGCSTSTLSSTSMLDTVKRYISERRGGLTRAASYAGSAYLAVKYVTRSLQETRDSVIDRKSVV